MSLHRDATVVLTGWSAPDAEQETLRSGFLAHLAEHPDALARSCHPDHLTAGALVLDRDRERVLLNLHRKSGRWFHFGGHLETDDTTLAGGALREAVEESGLRDLVIDPEPLHLSRHSVGFCDPRGPVDHLDVRFLARPGREVDPVVSEESLAVRWWALDALPTEEPDMLELVERALRR